MAEFGLPPSTDDQARRFVENRRRRREREAQARERARLAREAERERTRGRTAGEVATDAAIQLLSGSVSLGQAAFGAANFATAGALDRVTGLSDNFPQTQEILQRAKSAPTQARAEDVQRAFEEDGLLAGARETVTSLPALQDLIVSNAPSVGPSLGAARFAGQAALRAGTAPGSRLSADALSRLVQRRSTTAAIRTGGIQAGGATNIDAINRIREAGGTEGEAQLGGLGAGAIAGVATPLISRFTGAGRLEAAVGTRGIGGGRFSGLPSSIAGRTVSGAGRESAEEAIQSSVEQGSSNLFAPGVDVREGTGQAAVTGFIAGGAIGGPLGAASGGGRTRNTEEAPTEPQSTTANVRRDSDLRDRVEEQAERAGEQSTPIRRPFKGRGRQDAPDLATLINQRLGVDRAPALQEQDIATEQDLSDAQAEQLAELVFGRGQDENGDTVFGELDPDTQSIVPMTREEALARVEQIPQEAIDQLPEETLPLPEVEEQSLPLPEVTSERQARVQNIEVDQLPDDTPPSPQVEFEAQGRIEQLDDIGLPTDPDVRIGRRASLQASIAQNTGTDRVGAPSPRPLSAREATQQQVDALVAERFVTGTDQNGDPEFGRFDTDLQRIVPLSQRQAEALARRELNTDPLDLWKRRLREDLDLPAQAFKGKAFNRFAAVVRDTGIRPDSPEAAEFLSSIAPSLPSSDADTSRFAVRMAEQFAAPSDPEVVVDREEAAEEAGEAQVDQDVAPQAEASARQRSLAEDAPPAEAVVPDPEPAQPVPLVAMEEPSELPAVKSADARIRVRAKRFVSEGEVSEASSVVFAFAESFYDAATASELDAQFMVQKQTPAFRELPQRAQDALVQEFNDLHNAMESVGRFKRKEQSSTEKLSLTEFERLVRNANDNAPADIPVAGHLTAADFRQATGQAAPNDIQGVFMPDGAIHLIRENIPNRTEFASVLLHERGHGGLRGLMGDRLPAVINRMYANAAVRKRIEEVRQRLGVDRMTAGEEVLADMIAGGETLTGDLRGKIKNSIAQGAARILGVGDLRVSDRLVDEVLTATSAHMRGRSISGSLELADALRNVELDRIVGDPGVLSQAPLYSRNLNALDAAIKDLDQASPGTTIFDSTLSKSNRFGRDGIIKLVQDLKDKTFRGALHATPLFWVARTYGRLWQTEGSDVNHLRDYAANVQAREAESNRLINREFDATYDGPSESGTVEPTPVKMKVSPAGIAKEHQAFKSDAPRQAQAFDAMQQFSTLFRIWPDRPFEQQSDVDHQRVGFTEAERREAFTRLQRLWRETGPRGRALFRQTQADFKRQWGARFEALSNELSRSTGIPRRLPDGSTNPEFSRRFGDTIGSALNRLRSGPFSPLSRFGRFVTVVRDENGEVVSYQGFDTQAEAQNAASAARNERTEDGQNFTTEVAEGLPFIRSLDGINQDALGNIEQNLIDSLPADIEPHFKETLLDGVREAFLQSVPKDSILAHANERKGIAGFTLDTLRAYTDYTMKNTRAIADYNHNGNIARSLLGMANHVRELGRQGGNTVKHTQVLASLRKGREMYIRTETNPAADFISQAGFLQYLTSPSQLFVNSMQTAMVAFPRLSGVYGGGRALKQLGSALTDFVSSRGDLLGDNSVLEPDVRQAMEILREDGTLDFTQTSDLLDLAGGDLEAMSGHWHAIKRVLGGFVHKSEVFNRQVTATAAARLEMPALRERFNLTAGQPLPQEALQELANVAKQATHDSHFIFSQSDKPPLLQGPFRKLLFQFQHFRFNMLAMMARDIRDSFSGTPAEKQTARRTLAYLIGTQAAFTGVAGTIMAPVAFALMDLFRDDDDLLDSRTEFSRHAPQWLVHGLFSGAVDMRRLDSGSLLPILGDRAFAPTDASARETLQYYLFRNLGPWVGLGSDIVTMAEKLAEGEMVDALEAGLPKPFRDAVKAASGINGVEDARDVVYFQPGIGSTVAQAVGLTSGARREAEDLRNASFRLSKRVSTVRGRYIGMAALGLSSNDPDLVEEAYGKIRAWNAQFPDFAIDRSDIQRSITSKFRAQVMTDLFGVATQGPIKPSALEALNL